METSKPFQDEVRRSANDIEKRLKDLKNVQMDNGKTFPHKVAELWNYLNEDMESQATPSPGRDRRFVGPGNCLHRLEGCKPLKEGEDERPVTDPNPAKARRAARSPRKGLSRSDTVASSYLSSSKESSASLYTGCRWKVYGVVKSPGGRLTYFWEENCTLIIWKQF